MKDYEIESALDTLIRAKEIQGNKELMKKVSELASKKKKVLTSLEDLKEARLKALTEPDEEEESEDDEEEEDSKSINIKINLQQKESLMTEEDKAELQEKKILDKKDKEFYKNVDKEY